MTKNCVVIIEDNLDDSEVIKQGLSLDKYDLQCFEEGSVALDYLKNNAKNVDVVVMGKTIPNISGLQILEHMQKHPHLKDIPVIVQTIDGEKGNQNQAIAQGADFYLMKPLDAKKIAVFVKTAIRTSRKNNGGGSGGGSFAGALKKSRRP